MKTRFLIMAAMLMLALSCTKDDVTSPTGSALEKSLFFLAEDTATEYPEIEEGLVANGATVAKVGTYSEMKEFITAKKMLMVGIIGHVAGMSEKELSDRLGQDFSLISTSDAAICGSKDEVVVAVAEGGAKASVAGRAQLYDAGGVETVGTIGSLNQARMENTIAESIRKGAKEVSIRKETLDEVVAMIDRARVAIGGLPEQVVSLAIPDKMQSVIAVSFFGGVGHTTIDFPLALAFGGSKVLAVSEAYVEKGTTLLKEAEDGKGGVDDGTEPEQFRLMDFPVGGTVRLRVEDRPVAFSSDEGRFEEPLREAFKHFKILILGEMPYTEKDFIVVAGGKRGLERYAESGKVWVLNERDVVYSQEVASKVKASVPITVAFSEEAVKQFQVVAAKPSGNRNLKKVDKYISGCVDGEKSLAVFGSMEYRMIASASSESRNALPMASEGERFECIIYCGGYASATLKSAIEELENRFDFEDALSRAGYVMVVENAIPEVFKTSVETEAPPVKYSMAGQTFDSLEALFGSGFPIVRGVTLTASTNKPTPAPFYY